MKQTYFQRASMIICLLLVWLVASSSVIAQEFKTVRDGIEYAELTRTISGLPVRMNLLRLDLKKVRLDVVHAMDMAIGTETVSSMANRHDAFAAINAGFFRLDKSEFAGDDVGYLLIDRYIWSEPSLNRSVFGIANERTRTQVSFNKWSFAGYLRWNSKDYPNLLKGFNREIKDNEIVVYTPAFGKLAPRTAGQISAVVRKKRIIATCLNECEIPSDGFVLSGSGDKATFMRQLNIGDRIQFIWDTITDKNTWPRFKLEDAVAGVPQLIKNGKIDITWQEEKASKSFVETRHPRTAVAKLKDGKFLMITVDGRSESSGGLSLYDLAALLLEFGAVDAMNLDGGGSTTMFLDGKVVNKPSDKEGERKVSDAILVTLRK
jgi:hypothetical protein